MHVVFKSFSRSESSYLVIYFSNSQTTFNKAREKNIENNLLISFKNLICCLLEVVSDAQVMTGNNGQGVIELGHLKRKQCLLMLKHRGIKRTVFISETQ